ncbi:hypothetical protein GQ44DRAFT_249176 [Phaeosphaeriaceae sp. PMI808]|nr:hypothetical protein GQ44DRAFT_249176 [Phaeosphaeriaceae sp. PMI808]
MPLGIRPTWKLSLKCCQMKRSLCSCGILLNPLKALSRLRKLGVQLLGLPESDSAYCFQPRSECVVFFQATLYNPSTVRVGAETHRYKLRVPSRAVVYTMVHNSISLVTAKRAKYQAECSVRANLVVVVVLESCSTVQGLCLPLQTVCAPGWSCAACLTDVSSRRDHVQARSIRRKSTWHGSS